MRKFVRLFPLHAKTTEMIEPKLCIGVVLYQKFNIWIGADTVLFGTKIALFLLIYGLPYKVCAMQIIN